jgi:hypothetical protein
MSRGAGRVQRMVLQLFLDDPNGVFSTAYICQHVYGRKRVQKKHRVAVLRALRLIAAHDMPELWRAAQRHERSDIWFDHRFHPKDSSDSASALEQRPKKDP